MAKRYLLILTLLCLCAFSAFSLSSGNEENEANEWKEWNEANFLSLDVYTLGIGARYERLLSSKFSVGVDAYVDSLFLFTVEIEACVFTRYYLWRGLYGELGLGFHIYNESEDKHLESPYPITITGNISGAGVAISPGLGWKFDPGKAGGFFIEPGISVPITIGKKIWYEGVGSTSYGEGESESGVRVGFVIYCGLGWAF